MTGISTAWFLVSKEKSQVDVGKGNRMAVHQSAASQSGE